MSLNPIPQISKHRILQIIEDSKEAMYDSTKNGALENALAYKRRLEAAKQMLANWEKWNKGVL